MIVSEGKLSVWEKAGYGLGDFASCIFWQAFTVFLLFFYTDIYGIPAGIAGTIFLVSRIWDCFFDPIMGMIADRTKTRWGSFRPYLLWMAIPFGLIGILTFTTPAFSLNGKVIYAFITYTLMMTVYSAINIPYGALLGVLSSSSRERTSLSAYKFTFAYLGNLVVSMCTIYLVKYFGKGDQKTGYQLTVILYALLSVTLFILSFLSVRERVTPPQKEKTAVKTDLKDLLDNKPWILLFVISLGWVFFSSARFAAMIYYFKYFVKDESLTAAYLTIGTIAGIAGVFVTNYLRLFISRKTLFIAMVLLTSVFSFAGYFVQPAQTNLLFFYQILLNFVSGAAPSLIWAMFADTADYSEWRTGRRATGLVFSASSFSQKLGWAIGGALAGWLLSFYGFEANVAQTAASANGIRLMFSVFPAIGTLIACTVMYFYPLTEKKMREIEEEIKVKKMA